MSSKIPQSVEAETWIIGSILLSGTSVMDEISPKLNEEHFFTRTNKIIWNTCRDLHAQQKPIDSMTVIARLKDQNKIQEVGGEYAVFKMGVSVPTSAHAEYWVEVLEEKRLLRKSLEIAAWLNKEAQSADDVLGLLSEFERKILNLREVSTNGNMTETAIRIALERNQKLLDGIRDFGISSGIKCIDEAIGGLCFGQLFYICARAGRGKTALIEQIMFSLIMSERPFLIFEKDMSIDTLVERMACRAARVIYGIYRKGRTSREQTLLVKHWLEKFNRMKDRFIIQSPVRLTSADIVSIVRREKSKNGIQSVFLDHILNLDLGKQDFREGLTRASIDLRRSAQESRLPHVILAQLNREGHSGRPDSRHVKEFDQAFADSDAMMMIWSETDPKDLDPGDFLPVTFSIVKNRNGPQSDETMYFDGSFMEFRETDREKK